MEHQKIYMKKKELMELGLSSKQLDRIARTVRGVAFKMDATKPNSPWLFDTEKLEKYLRAQSTGR